LIQTGLFFLLDQDQKLRSIILICPARDSMLVVKTIYRLIKCRQVRNNLYLQVFKKFFLPGIVDNIFLVLHCKDSLTVNLCIGISYDLLHIVPNGTFHKYY